jgi:hypothetical protein
MAAALPESVVVGWMGMLALEHGRQASAATGALVARTLARKRRAQKPRTKHAEDASDAAVTSPAEAPAVRQADRGCVRGWRKGSAPRSHARSVRGRLRAARR